MTRLELQRSSASRRTSGEPGVDFPSNQAKLRCKTSSRTYQLSIQAPDANPSFTTARRRSSELHGGGTAARCIFRGGAVVAQHAAKGSPLGPLARPGHAENTHGDTSARHGHGGFMELTGDGTARSRREVHGAGDLRYMQTGKEGLTAVTLGRLTTSSSSWDEGRRLPSSEPKTSTAGSTARRRSWPRGLQLREGKHAREDGEADDTRGSGDCSATATNSSRTSPALAEQDRGGLLLWRRREGKSGRNGTLEGFRGSGHWLYRRGRLLSTSAASTSMPPLRREREVEDDV